MFVLLYVIQELCVKTQDKLGPRFHIYVPVKHKLLLTIWTLATTESFRQVANRFGTTKGNKIIRTIVILLVTVTCLFPF